MTNKEKLKLLSSTGKTLGIKDITVDTVLSRNHIKITKLQLNNFRFFVDNNQNNTFNPNDNGMLLYGENGSGKSSIFKAFKFLSQISKTDISKEFKKNKNIHKLDQNTSINFEFNNDEIIEINDDSDTNSDLPFINNLSVFMPMLNYQNLLNISQDTNEDTKNLYLFFETILKDYPVEDKTLQDLKVNQDERYLDIFEKIIQNELFENINIFLNEFNQDFKLINIKFNKAFKIVTLDIDLFDSNIDKYHTFLNEARLSSLAISVYFAVIKKQFALLNEDSLKILVLDDLLISLDMNNRLHLINILKNEFSDFQIFFFTHEKALFEMMKDKLNLKAYEIYTDINNDNDDKYEIPFLKKSNSLLEQAKYHNLQKEYDCSANKLRQCTEKIMCKCLEPEEFISKDCKRLDLSKMIDKVISKEKKKDTKNDEFIVNLEKLQTYRQILFNTGSHHDDTNIYKKEIEEAIYILDTIGIKC